MNYIFNLCPPLWDMVVNVRGIHALILEKGHGVLQPKLALKADPMGNNRLPTSMNIHLNIFKQPQLFLLSRFWFFPKFRFLVMNHESAIRLLCLICRHNSPIYDECQTQSAWVWGNGLIKTIQTIPHSLYMSFKLASLYCGKAYIQRYGVSFESSW